MQLVVSAGMAQRTVASYFSKTASNGEYCLRLCHLAIL